ncbi:MBL fold metallo-hydrolase [Tissierella sp. Yu-01]|uniref:MBL fold metallo-hydrolase n=1 Tax=Tissierella sp. Yu-01 TaxID=3035694 RepID=UPI00240D5562|nr:MBL fold metallo-hydrolase [Tissierella sp. Yu-01]WFA09345.1 MBL fold metallo-hydrolase [Tissierella sp. Yu-01]
MDKDQLDYMQPIKVADGIYWVGFADDNAGLYCNPYIIIEDDEAVLIDAGSRDEFSTVMLKILRLGVNPKSIKRLIYQHSDPDLCASIPQFEAIIDSNELKIISHKKEIVFINYYSSRTEKLCIEDLSYEYNFKSGRKLKFIRTPYSHAPGSFMTYDLKTKTLFTSDIFGSFDKNWSLYKPLPKECQSCSPQKFCVAKDKECRINEIIRFHQNTMNSAKALRYALDQIEALDVELIAPQHGSLIDREYDKTIIIKHLRALENIGFDYFMQREIK